jgi:hypothetical protein
VSPNVLGDGLWDAQHRHCQIAAILSSTTSLRHQGDHLWGMMKVTVYGTDHHKKACQSDHLWGAQFVFALSLFGASTNEGRAFKVTTYGLELG